MIYNILFISDIHWGALPPVELYSHLYAVQYFIEKMKGKIDLIVFGGDYFDSRLQLNSKSAIFALQWMQEIYDLAIQCGVHAIRIIKGTEEHDNDQLDAFQSLDSNFFKIFRTCTVEETLPLLNCIYCPDETLPWKEYEEKYVEQLMQRLNIGFFHGSFDKILPEIALQISEEQNRRSVIFPLYLFAERINGPLVAGHWHSRYFDDPLYYSGSYDSWAHGEGQDKGFTFLRYDTSNGSYQVFPILNPVHRVYETIVTEVINENTIEDTLKDLHGLIALKKRTSSEDGKKKHIRVLFRLRVDSHVVRSLIDAFTKVYIDDKTIKVTVVDYVKRDKKKEKKERVQAVYDRYPFLFEKAPISKKIQDFLHVKREKDYPIDLIKSYVLKYRETDDTI